MDKKTLKVKCFITGDENIFSGEYLSGLVEKYGSKENLLKYFISFKAKNLLFKGHSIKEIRNILVNKKVELEDENSEKALELLKYWQDQKDKKVKFKINSNDKITFTKTDKEVKDFLEKWKNFNNSNLI